MTLLSFSQNLCNRNPIESVDSDWAAPLLANQRTFGLLARSLFAQGLLSARSGQPFQAGDRHDGTQTHRFLGVF